MVGGWGQSPSASPVNPLKKAEEAPAISVEVALGWIWAVVLVSPPVGEFPAGPSSQLHLQSCPVTTQGTVQSSVPGERSRS